MNVALVLAGGTGTRLGADIPKQYIDVKGKPIILYCLETLSMIKEIDAIQIVSNTEWYSFLKRIIVENQKLKMKIRGFSEPGENRQLSILNGVKDVCAYTSREDIVLIHDAARPLLSKKLVLECLNACKSHDGVLPVLPMKDTIYLSKDGKTISSLLDRKELFAGQAPEAFRIGKYLDANQALLPNQIKNINGSTEPAILFGMDIVTIPGDECNFKITTKDDLEQFRHIVE